MFPAIFLHFHLMAQSQHCNSSSQSPHLPLPWHLFHARNQPFLSQNPNCQEVAFEPLDHFPCWFIQPQEVFTHSCNPKYHLVFLHPWLGMWSGLRSSLSLWRAYGKLIAILLWSAFKTLHNNRRKSNIITKTHLYMCGWQNQRMTIPYLQLGVVAAWSTWVGRAVHTCWKTRHSIKPEGVRYEKCIIIGAAKGGRDLVSMGCTWKQSTWFYQSYHLN